MLLQFQIEMEDVEPKCATTENTEGKDVEVGLGRNTTATTTSSKLQLECLPGQHNHISPVLSLGTRIPAEEAWGRRVVDFVATTSTSRYGPQYVIIFAHKY